MRGGWQQHEADMAKLFGARKTITSGNKFYDPGDVVSSSNETFPIFADCKYTEHSSMSIKLLTLRDLTEKAASLGKRFIMPIRYHVKAEGNDEDFVLLSAHDFAELLRLANE
jgi:hypothetical protein